MELDAYPGGDLIRQGLDDLAQGKESVAGLLVQVGAPRLRQLGFQIPESAHAIVEHRLYEILAREDSDSAHSRYNALIRLLVSFETSGRIRRLADEERIRRFMRGLGAAADAEARLYFTGETTAVLLGWRSSTVDVDIRFIPELDSLFRALTGLKEELELNIELASPADFIPELPGWEGRSRFITREGKVSFFHYDLYAQALAKIERGHAPDIADVAAMLERGLVDREKLRGLFEEIFPKLYRYPAIDPDSFRRALEKTVELEQ